MFSRIQKARRKKWQIPLTSETKSTACFTYISKFKVHTPSLRKSLILRFILHEARQVLWVDALQRTLEGAHEAYCMWPCRQYSLYNTIKAIARSHTLVCFSLHGKKQCIMSSQTVTNSRGCAQRLKQASFQVIRFASFDSHDAILCSTHKWPLM